MARTRPHVSPTAATSARVGRTDPGLANASARARRDARAELARQVDRAFEQAPELARQHQDSQWPIRYLEAVRGFKPPPPPMSPADQVKLAHAQADQIVQAIIAVLDGLGLSEEDWERGHNLAADALRAASAEGWSPL